MAAMRCSCSSCKADTGMKQHTDRHMGIGLFHSVQTAVDLSQHTTASNKQQQLSKRLQQALRPHLHCPVVSSDGTKAVDVLLSTLHSSLAQNQEQQQIQRSADTQAMALHNACRHRQV